MEPLVVGGRGDGRPVQRGLWNVAMAKCPAWGLFSKQHELAEREIQIPIVFITGHGDVPLSVRAMKAGATEDAYAKVVAQLN